MNTINKLQCSDDLTRTRMFECFYSTSYHSKFCALY